MARKSRKSIAVKKAAPGSVPAAHGRFAYSAIVDRPPMRWPNGARVAVWVIPNIEHFLFDRPSTSIPEAAAGRARHPQLFLARLRRPRRHLAHDGRDANVTGCKGTVALNSDVCHEYPRIIEEGKKLGWEWMGHGITNSMLLNDQSEAEERAMIKEVVTIIDKRRQARAAGSGPALTETVHTLDILAENGIEYVGNWVNDEQPYPMKVKRARMFSMPYSAEINDIPALLGLHQSPEAFGQMICDQFDVLYEEAPRPAG